MEDTASESKEEKKAEEPSEGVSAKKSPFLLSEAVSSMFIKIS